MSPFFGLHFQSYAIYWQLSDADSWKAQKLELEKSEKLQRQLDARTVDRVRVGEQQPEIDHNLQSEKSYSGAGRRGKHWRQAKDGGWFSYEMKLPPKGTKASLRAVYWGQDRGRKFDIQIDGKVLATQKFEGGKKEYYSVEYPIGPELTAGKKKVIVRFQAPKKGIAGGVFDLRIVTVK